MSNPTLPEWPYAHGGPSGSGDIKTFPDDFIVEEILSFTPEGSGEHVFLHIEKAGENTEYIARLLARHAGVRRRDVGFAGMKDRHGRTRQWFSVWLPTPRRQQEAFPAHEESLPGKQDPDWSALESDQLKILQSVRHARKLRRGVLAGNDFSLLIRHWQGQRDTVEQQLRQIKISGFPNYFGEQRFGRQGNNIPSALAMFEGGRVKREQRAIYLSAARSFLFNQILAERVRQKNWNQALSGDVFNLNHSNSHFQAEIQDPALLQRLSSGDIHPTGTLWGKGDNRVEGTALALEQQIIALYKTLADGLTQAGLEAGRRALRVIPENLNWCFETDTDLRLSFRLPAGSYATALLREIAHIHPHMNRNP